MNVLVIGAAGKTGRQVVEQAVAAGHTVTAFIRDSAQYNAPPNVRVFTGDATDPATMSHAIADQDAVIDTVGGKTPWRKTEIEQRVAHAIVAAAKQHGTCRIIAISALGVGDSTAQATLLFRLLLLPTFLRGSTADKTAMEQAIAQAGVPYVLVRPAVLNDQPAVGSVRVLAGVEKGRQITRADLAAFVVEQLTTDTHVNRAVTIANS
ncbi:NAD(P)-dependent oxidoreductase [Trichocoleus sp. FACHB-262]|uniref:NAD(P)-dependent oxidoreductase n=1 Tax=Trichocoleus sp. FACHB-262 TaxID=2692869 RepID=UPI0016885992|nr:NAD(P)H-binding protein [Trichocoleus sp. FACHB-262]MBD2120428.1 NAD(P)H-binding protein [Trichocoleus sp. FACHB-262]